MSATVIVRNPGRGPTVVVVRTRSTQDGRTFSETRLKRGEETEVHMFKGFRVEVSEEPGE